MLVDDGNGELVPGPAVSVATPEFAYSPPVPADPDNTAQPANIVATIPAPVVPIPANKQFGEPTWVKVIKTTAHNSRNIPLKELTGDDTNGDGLSDWTNGEPEEVEREWKLLRINNDPFKVDKDFLQGALDTLENSYVNVTRRYEFYRYVADDNQVIPTTDPTSPNYLHGKNSSVAVIDANGNTYTIDCSRRVVVGGFIGAQMAGFDPQAGFGLIDHLPDGELNQPYTPRMLVIGYDMPYSQVTPSRIVADDNPALPAGMSIDPQTGVLSGNTCFAYLDPDSSVSLTATPASGYVFKNWNACPGSANANTCTVTMDNDKYVTANFVPVQFKFLSLGIFDVAYLHQFYFANFLIAVKIGYHGFLFLYGINGFVKRI